MATLSQNSLEELRKEGIDAYNAGRSRSDNPYSYEASNAWDAGWVQAWTVDMETKVKA